MLKEMLIVVFGNFITILLLLFIGAIIVFIMDRKSKSKY